jgi:S1-C subfamily serine protease
MFIAVGLAGAVLAGSLAVVFASQRVDRLTRETAGARADLASAAEDVREAADEALEAITAEADAIRDQFATDLPYEDAAQAGVVHLVLEAQVPDPAVSPAPAQQEQQPDPEDQEDGEPDAEPQAPPPRPTLDLRRRASGFVVAGDAETAFVATTFALMADPSRPDVPLDVGVRVLTAGGETTGRVHSWQASRDLLLLRVPLRGIEPMPWRPADEPVGAGDRITAVGVTPGLAAIRVGGTVAAADANALISDLPALELLAGGPVVDAQGRVVAVGSSRYSPFGNDPVAVPVRLLCEDLLARCPD